ncbi:unnamed protein product, partial [Durusdinium trenchii]
AEATHAGTAPGRRQYRAGSLPSIPQLARGPGPGEILHDRPASRRCTLACGEAETGAQRAAGRLGRSVRVSTRRWRRMQRRGAKVRVVVVVVVVLLAWTLVLSTLGHVEAQPAGAAKGAAAAGGGGKKQEELPSFSEFKSNVMSKVEKELK